MFKLKVRCFRHLVWVPLASSSSKCSGDVHLGVILWIRHRTWWGDFISQQAWGHIGIPLEELEEVAGDKVWVAI